MAWGRIERYRAPVLIEVALKTHCGEEILFRGGLREFEAFKAFFQIAVFDLAKHLKRRRKRGYGFQTLFGITFMLCNVPSDQWQEQIPIGRRQITLLHEDVFQGPRFLQHPGAHPLDQLIAGEEFHLVSEDTEEKISIRSMA